MNRWPFYSPMGDFAEGRLAIDDIYQVNCGQERSITSSSHGKAEAV